MKTFIPKACAGGGRPGLFLKTGAGARAAGAEEFDYDRAFGRNLGLVSEAEQGRLRRTRVGLPGLGGVGGGHAEVLARLGIGAFHLADPDRFELANLNRQLGAALPTLGRAKAQVAEERIVSLNPQAQVRVFPQGIGPENLASFLEGVDVVVDGLEFFAIELRRMLYAECRCSRKDPA